MPPERLLVLLPLLDARERVDRFELLARDAPDRLELFERDAADRFGLFERDPADRLRDDPFVVLRRVLVWGMPVLLPSWVDSFPLTSTTRGRPCAALI